MLFTELSEADQAKAIELFQRLEQDNGMDYLHECLTDRLAVVLSQNEMEVENLDTQYSLGYCQGDGFMFSGNVTWKGRVYEVRQSGYYSHNGCKTIDIDWDELPPNSSMETIKLLTVDFDDVYREICDQLEAFGYGVIEEALSEETIRENIIANEYDFEVKDPGVVYL